MDLPVYSNSTRQLEAVGNEAQPALLHALQALHAAAALGRVARYSWHDHHMAFPTRDHNIKGCLWLHTS
jgi:hypothetical protein